MPRPSNTAQRRQEITLAFLSVLAETGYSSATIRAIAKEAELTPGLIHHHFENKQAILINAVEYLTAIAEVRFIELAEKTNTPRDKLLAFLEARLNLGEGANINAVRAWVLIGSEAVRLEEVNKIYQASVARQHKQLVKLLRESDVSTRPPLEYKQQAATILAAIEGAYLLGVTCSDVMPKGFAFKSISKLV